MLVRTRIVLAHSLQGLAELDRVMKGLLDVQAVMTGHSKVLSDIIQNVARGQDIVRPYFCFAEPSNYVSQSNANEQYLMLVDEMNAEYDSKTTRQKYAKNDQYVSFKEAIYVCWVSSWHMAGALTLHPRKSTIPEARCLPSRISSLGVYTFTTLPILGSLIVLAEANDESDDDDDVVMGGVTQEYKCPLMMTLLKDPLTSQVVGFVS